MTVTVYGPETTVNSTTSGEQNAPTITSFADGRYIVTWTDTGATNGDTSSYASRAQIFNADGSKSGNEFLLNSTTTQSQSNPVISVLADGHFVATWVDNSQLHGDTSGSCVIARIYNANGSPAGSEFRVNTTTSGSQTETTITTLANGNFVITWTDSSATGTDTSDQAIRGQIYTSAGTPVGEEFAVNTTTTNAQTAADITALQDGGFVVTWTDDSQTGDDTSGTAIRAQAFNADGTLSGTEFLVNTATTLAQSAPSIATLADGRFIITWTDFSASGDDTSESAIRAQIYDANGTLSGAAFLVNTTTTGSQFNSEVTTLADGRFVVTWTNGTDAGGAPSYNIRAQVFNANGTLSGSEFTVNTTTTGAQQSATVTALADGRIVISWMDDSGSGSDNSDAGIRSQIFDPRESAVTYAGSAGGDQFVGTGFNDALSGGVGADKISGGGGNDTVDGGTEADQLSGNAGDDSLDGGSGADTVSGGDGSDTLNGGIDGDHLSGNNGDDILNGGAGADTAYGGDGNDTLNGDTESDYLSGGTGNDLLDGGAGADTLYGGDGTDTLTGGTEADQLSGGYGDDIVDGGTGADTLYGDDGHDTVTGGSEADQLYGNAGNDSLDGGTGADTLYGGSGDDTITIDSVGDMVVETSNNGYDRVQSNTISLDLTDYAFVERAVLYGTLDLNASGTNNGDYITGNNAINTLTGLDGQDSLLGFGGDDNILGGAGNDIIDGGTGSDTMAGGTDSDLYSIDVITDVVIEAEASGADRVQTSTISLDLVNYLNVEHATLLGALALDLTGNAVHNLMIGNSANNILTGLAGYDTLIGNAGNDQLFGGTGNDRLEGGDNNDTLIGDAGLDLMLGGTGADSMVGGIHNDTLDGGDGNDTMAGDADTDVLLGGGGNDVMSGGTGNDRLDGGIGTDTAVGGLGDDTYVVDAALDVVTEDFNGGTDTLITASITINLGSYLNVERVTLQGNLALNAYGNNASNWLIGNNAANTLLGLDGNDYLFGYNGDDVMRGGLGRDVLSGGGAADDFVFATAAEAGMGTATRDHITDFQTGVDDIVLTGFMAGGSFIGAAAFTNVAEQVRYDKLTGIVSGDVNGDGVADFEIALDSKPTLTAADFIF